MILKVEDVSKYGVRVDKNVPSEVVSSAIQNAELLYVKPMLGNVIYNKFVEDAENNTPNVLIDGGKYIDGDNITYIAGIKCAIANIAYAFLVHNKMNATAFGSVIKDSELSHSEDAFKYAKMNVSIGTQYIFDVAEVMHIEQLGKPKFQMWGIK